MTRPAERLERAARDALIEAARVYADLTDGTHGDNPLAAGARLRLAAKEWRRAERAKNEAPSIEVAKEAAGAQ